jgi:hypothetical protein
MYRLERLLLYLLVVLGTVRMALFFDYAAAMLPRQMESHNLEAKMVLLAYRAEHGLGLYPAWWDYPHLSNWFGPVAPVLVGRVGRAVESNIPGLFQIGRAVSFGSALLTTLLLAVALGRRFGRGAGLAGGVLSLGSGPMYGFTVMVRPDSLAELLGTSGFLASSGRTSGARIAGLLLLVLAVLTKQTAAIFLLAAALAATLEGERKRGLLLLLGSCALLLVVVSAVTLLGEPHFAASLVGERIMPWSYTAWRELLGRMLAGCPDLFILPAIGLFLWLRGGTQPRAVRPAVLTGLLLVGSLGLSAKTGADMNYYLSLRVAAALAAGALWHAVERPAPEAEGGGPKAPRSAGPLALLIVANLALIPSILLAAGYVVLATHEVASRSSPEGRQVLRSYQEAFALARDPRVHLLSDTGIIDLYQGERALFGDPWLFRTLVESGRLQPRIIEDRIESQYYDIIITSHDLESPGYLREDFRLPKGLVERIQARYVLKSAPRGLFAYGRRPGPTVP